MISQGIILALDLGAKQTGLALFKEGFVVGRGVVGGWLEWQQLSAQLSRVIAEEQVARIVVGVPHSPSGDQARQYETYIAVINKKFALPVSTVDETLTSVAAREQGASTDDHEGAAKIILEDYLAQNR
ncbi:MAG TPA: Holliday junction resolvase RuvX [Patescibacteria group bacterium]|nr:Holliday junction resolvase RuvX [Patescibacteria group bacterium]